MTPTDEGEIKGKMSTMKKFERFDIVPNEPKKTLDKFLHYQRGLLELLDQAREVDIQRVKVKSAIGSIIMFKLGDAFRFVIGHNRRHIIQAREVYQQQSTSENQAVNS